MTISPRLSMACLYNMKSSHLQLLDDSDMISPMSTVQSTPVSFSAQPAVVSPADTRSTYFTDEKCAMPIQAYDGIEVVPEQPRRPSRGLEVVLQHPPGYSVGGAQVNYINADAELPARSNLVPFWRRYLLLIIAGIFLLLIIIAGVAVGINKAKANGSVSKAANGSLAGSNTTSSTELGVTNTTSVAKLAVTNSTRDSVASSGLWLKDGTFNKYLFNQKSSGRITLQVSLDGETYEDYQNVTLTIPPKVGSPLSATAEEDSQTGVVMINLFYLSGDKTVSNVTMSAITCPANSASCNTINNCLLPTKIPTLVYTGLAAINVNNAQDWRVYYLDQEGAVSQLMGNGSGFDEGVKIGGTGLNTSSMAAVNYNMSTNNINLFYVDALTKNLFKMQYTGLTDNGWTTPSAVSLSKNETWNPYSGLGAAYNVDQDTLRVYYTGLDLGIYEFRGINASQTTNTTWDPIPGRNKVWAEADYVGADLTAVGFNETVNFYRVKDSKMVQATLEDIEWTEAFLSS